MGSTDPKPDPKAEFIARVQKLGRDMDALAEQAAAASVREPNNKGKRAEAERYVTIADARRNLSDQVVEIVHAFWPRPEPPEKKSS